MAKPVTFDKQRLLRWNEHYDRMLEDLRRNEPDLPQASEMMRRLVLRAHDKLPAAKRRK